jgi:hypothetical protein
MLLLVLAIAVIVCDCAQLRGAFRVLILFWQLLGDGRLFVGLWRALVQP